MVQLEQKNINALVFLNRQNNLSSRNLTKTVCMLMMTFILNGWQQAFSNKYRKSSKILTETTYKALFTTQKPRIYATIENQIKNVLVSFSQLQIDFTQG